MNHPIRRNLRVPALFILMTGNCPIIPLSPETWDLTSSYLLTTDH